MSAWKRRKKRCHAPVVTCGDRVPDHRDQYWTVLNYSRGHCWPEGGNKRDQQEDWEWMWAQKGCPSLSLIKGSMKIQSVKTPKKQRKPQGKHVTVRSSFHVKMYQTSTPNAKAGRLPWVWGHLGYSTKPGYRVTLSQKQTKQNKIFTSLD